MLPTIELPPRAAYNRWSANYRTSGRNVLAETAERAVCDLLPDVRGLSLLDVGCGDGRWMHEAVAGGAARVIGIDFSPGMLAAALDGPAAIPGVTVCAGDMRHLPFGRSVFDGLVNALALGHVPDPGAALAEAARVLRPGGWMVLADVHPSAADRGWQRTFRDSEGGRYAVRWHPHAMATLVEAGRAAGLDVARVVERAIDAASLPPGAPASATAGPAVYAMLMRSR